MKINLMSGVLIATICCGCSEHAVSKQNSSYSSHGVRISSNSVSLGRDTSPVKTEDRTLGTFSKLGALIPGKVDVTIGSPQSVKVTCNQDSLAKIATRVQGDTLIIESDNVNVERLEVSVVVAKLEAVQVSGSGSATFKNMDKSGLSKINVSGASGALLDSVKTNNFDVMVSGASKLKVGGSCDNLNLVVTGASGAALSDLTTQNCTVNISGASSGNARVIDKVSGTVTGASGLILSGKPRVNEVVARGASGITIR